MTTSAHFSIPPIEDNEEGWGPSSIPDKFKDIPYYAPYNKGDKLGRAADWQQQQYPGKGRYPKESKDGVSTIFNWYYTDDDSSFQLVDNTKTTTKKTYGAKRFQNRGNQQLRQHKQQSWQATQQKGKQQPRKHQNLQSRWGTGRKWGGQDSTPQKRREPSIEIKPTWKLLETIDFHTLGKCHVDAEPQPEDVETCGSLEYYDKAYDRVSSKSEKPLERTDRTFFNVTTSEDPVINKLSAEDKATVFATDAILSHLMACTRSVYPWDILITKVNGKIFFDKRDGSQFDLLTVNETAIDPPPEEPKDSINSASSLMREATFINQHFSQQVLVKGEVAATFNSPNPFQSEGEKVSATAYKYRRWRLNDDSLIVRCEIDGASRDGGYLTIKALNEFDPKAEGWRKKIDSQKGAVLGTELKNNWNKLAKWTVQSLLAGTSGIKLGFVSRASAKDIHNHVILGISDFKPKEFAAQINLNMKNLWGILLKFVDIIKKLPDGKYVLLRDTEKNAVLLYATEPKESGENPKEEEKAAETSATQQ